jgi:boron transporter
VTGFPIIITLLIPLRWLWVPKIIEPKYLRIMDDLTANNEIVLASLGGAPKMHGEKEKDDDAEEREKQEVVREAGMTMNGNESQRRMSTYRSEEWGIERRFSEERSGVKRQRAGSR